MIQSREVDQQLICTVISLELCSIKTLTHAFFYVLTLVLSDIFPLHHAPKPVHQSKILNLILKQNIRSFFIVLMVIVTHEQYETNLIECLFPFDEQVHSLMWTKLYTVKQPKVIDNAVQFRSSSPQWKGTSPPPRPHRLHHSSPTTKLHGRPHLFDRSDIPRLMVLTSSFIQNCFMFPLIQGGHWRLTSCLLNSATVSQRCVEMYCFIVLL